MLIGKSTYFYFPRIIPAEFIPKLLQYRIGYSEDNWNPFQTVKLYKRRILENTPIKYFCYLLFTAVKGDLFSRTIHKTNEFILIARG